MRHPVQTSFKGSQEIILCKFRREILIQLEVLGNCDDCTTPLLFFKEFKKVLLLLVENYWRTRHASLETDMPDQRPIRD